MKTADLLSRVHHGNTKGKDGKFIKGKLTGYRLYGYMCSEIEFSKLNNYLKRLDKVNPADIWVSFRIMSAGDKEFIRADVENTEFAFGEIAVLVPQNTILNTWYQLEGNIRTVLYDGTGSECYVAGMQKVDNKWCVAPPKIEDLDLDYVSDIVGKYIEESENKQIFFQPPIPNGWSALTSSKFIDSSVETANPVDMGVLIQESKPSARTNNVNQLDKIKEAEKALAESKKQEFTQPETTSEENIFKESGIENISIQEQEQIAEPTQQTLSGIEENINSKKSKKLVFNEIPSKNIDWGKVVYHKRPDFKPTNRKEVKERTEIYGILKQISKNAGKVREQVLDKLVENFDIVNNEIYEKDKEEFSKLLENILAYSLRKPQGVGDSGQAIIKGYLGKQKECEKTIFSESSNSTSSLYDILISHGTEGLVDYMRKRSGIKDGRATLNIPDSDEVRESVEKILPSDIQACYAGLYGILLGYKSEDFIELGQKCKDAGVSFIKIVTENPYLLVLVDPDIKFLTLEVLANARGVGENVNVWRLACIMNEILKNQKGSTAFDIYDMSKQRVSYSIGKRGVSKINSYGSLLNDVQKTNIASYIDSGLTDKDWSYNISRYDSWGNCILSREDLQRAIVAYVNTGLGTVHEGILYSTRMLDKDMEIYDIIYKMAGINYEVDMSKIDKAIDVFEKMKSEEFGFTKEQIAQGKGFKLEPEQRDAVYNVNQKVLCVTGPAGSGKTTTVEAMIFCRDYCVKGEKSVLYAAPTGKAAKRLQEVVNKEVKTQHSMFGVYGSEDTEMADYNSEESNNARADYYVFDEQAMASTNLMYKVLKGVKKDACIFFVGDIEQLVPIESGKPFADFLRFLPTVVLRVSKRSAEGSDLAKNIKRMTEKSDEDYEELQDGSDTRLIDVEEVDIPAVVKDIVEHHLGITTGNRVNYVSNLGKIDADDIQIVSPVVSTRYSWGCDRLNPVLQDIFNPATNNASSEIVYGFGDDMTTIRVGSRVINTDNNYNARHYVEYKGGTLIMKNKAGVMNGDVGKVVAIYRGNECSEMHPVDEEYKKIYKNRPIYDNEKYFNSDYGIMVVEYYDTEDSCNYYIVYHAEINRYASTYSQIVCSTGNLKDIQLAYSLSVHKLQGSESKMVIFLCGKGLRLGDFLNRNMVYTAISRAKESLYVVGNIGMVERARKYKSSSARHSAMEDFV